MEPPNSTPGGICRHCDTWIEFGEGKHEYLEFRTPIPAEGGLPEVRGVWTSVHKDCP